MDEVVGVFRSEVGQVLRRIGRAPLFTAVTLIALTLGIGESTAVFSVVEGVLLKPLPYPDPEQLVRVLESAPGANIKRLGVSPSEYFIFREQNRSFTDIGAWFGDTVNVVGAGEPERVRAIRVTDGTLPILGTVPLLGRVFTRQ